MVENNINNIYKRKKSNGKFSDFAITTFGFPGDSILEKNEQDESSEK